MEKRRGVQAIPPFRVVRTPYDTSGLSPGEGPGAHRTRLYGNVQAAILQVFPAKGFRRRSDGYHLGVGRRVVQGLSLIVPFAYDAAAADYHGAYRDFSVGESLPGLPEGLSHESFIAIHVAKLEKMLIFTLSCITKTTTMAKAKLSEKIGYALGDAAAGGITWKVMSIAFPLFFTNVFGLTVADTATLMLVARLFDVITDPLMGALADRTQSRWGTYRPWLIFGAIPLGIIFALLLYTPDLGPAGKRIYAYSLYLLMMVAYTAVNVPYGSLLGVMTDDDNEKNQFSSYRMVGAYAMGFVTLLSFPYLQKMVGGSDAHQYAVLGVMLGALAALGTLACGLLTKERMKPVRAEKFSFKPFADLFRNKPWIYLTLIGICTNFFNGFRYAVAGYLLEYCLHGDVTVSGLIINYTVFMTFGEVTCMIFGGLSPRFTKWVGSKRKAFIWSAIICAVTSIAFYFIPMDPKYIWVMVAVVILTSIGIGLYSPLLWSMYADVADYATEMNGTSSTGLIFSSGTMAQKFGSAISGALVAALLGLAGFISGTDPATGDTIVTITNESSVCQMIWALFSLFPAAIALLILFLIRLYPIKK